ELDEFRVVGARIVVANRDERDAARGRLRDEHSFPGWRAGRRHARARDRRRDAKDCKDERARTCRWHEPHEPPSAMQDSGCEKKAGGAAMLSESLASDSRLPRCPVVPGARPARE